jgi:starch phosphorylase
MEPSERRNVVPHVHIFSGKAAPGYEYARKIIKLVHAVGDKVNIDPDIGDLLKVVSV